MKAATSKQQKSAARAQKKTRQTFSAPPVKEHTFSAWKRVSVVLIALTAISRLLYLTLKPLHHDEGVNGMFMVRLFRDGFYQYDPSNYHGPTLYYFALITSTLNSIFFGKAGLSTFAIRMVPAIFGTATVWLLLTTRRWLGTTASLLAAALLALSPAHLYFSRYFIHEVPFTFFTLALVVTLYRYREQGQSKHLFLAAAAAALLFATKETSVITLVVLLLAMLCTNIYMRLRQGRTVTAAPHAPGARQWAMAVLVFAAVSVTFYSSLFSNFPKGVYDSVRTFRYWFTTGTNAYQAPWFTYLQWLLQEEWPILLAGSIGMVIALYSARQRFAVFISFWALGMTAAYSLIPYKTPWLILNLLLPLAMTAGYGAQQCYLAMRSSAALKAPATVLLALGLVSSTWQAIDLSFIRYDDDRIPYVYGHTRREFLALITQIENVAAHNGQGRTLGVTVMAPEYWPLPWYLREYPNVGYWGHFIETAEPAVIAEEPQAAEIEQKLSVLYRRFGSYDLRPGVRLVLFLRRDQRP